MIRLANTPMPHVTNMSRSILDMFRIKDLPNNMNRPIPSPEPNLESNFGPDANYDSGHGNISPADWDELFRAVQVRLEHCVSDALHKAPELALHARHEVTRTVVQECVEAMRQLHAALVLERKYWQEHKQLHPQQPHEH